MVLLVRPRIGEEHVARARMVRGQEIVERVKRLEPQHLCIGEIRPAALAVEEPHAFEHALDAEEIAVGVFRGAARQELALAAANLYFKRARKVDFKRLAGIRYADYVRPRRFANQFAVHSLAKKRM